MSLLTLILTKLKDLKNHEGFLKYLKNTLWLFGEKILRMVVGLFVGIWVARYLGPEQFGLFSYAQSFVALFATIATLGLDGIVIRELVKDGSRRDELIGTAFWLKVIGAFGVLLILAIAINFTANDTYTNTLVFIIASATIFQSFNVVDMYFQAKVMSKFVVYANTISLFFSSLVKISLILNEAPLVAFAWAILFDSFVLACGFVYFYIKNNPTLDIKKLKFSSKAATELLKDSWPLMLSGVVVSIYMKIDQVMIKEMVSAEAVGQYAAAVKLSEGWYFISVLITSSLFPAIINAKKISEELYYNRLQKLYDTMVWMAIAMAIPMTFLSDEIVGFLYGDQYSESGSILMIHIWTGIFVNVGLVRSKFFIIENLQAFQTLYLSLGMVTNVILNINLINTYGVKGAAFATLITFILIVLVYPLFFKETKKTVKMILKTISYKRRKKWVK